MISGKLIGKVDRSSHLQAQPVVTRSVLKKAKAQRPMPEDPSPKTQARRPKPEDQSPNTETSVFGLQSLIFVTSLFGLNLFQRLRLVSDQS